MQVARLLFTSPAQAFTALKEKPVFALPMVLVILGSIAATATYYSKVDIAWLQDQLISQMKNLTADQQSMVAGRMTRPVLLWTSVISTPIGLTIAMVIGAVYFLVVGQITKVRYSFNHWFSFCWWIASPQVLGSVIAILTVMLSGSTQMGTGSLQPLSLNELVFHKNLGEPGYTWLSSIGLIQIASLWLTYIGIKAWSGRSTTFCLLFTLLPMLVIYGVWALFAFR
jgi:hypothetical protein